MFITAMWLLNIALLIGALVWNFCDNHFSQIASSLARSGVGITDPDVPAPLSLLNSRGRTFGFIAIVFGFAGSLGVILTSLLVGPSKHRRVSSWLALTALVACWLALIVGWHDLAWQGKQWRLARQVAAFEPAAEALRTAWPDNDGQRPEVGVFMAYPQPDPKMLLMLTPPAGRSPLEHFSAVERSPEGALRFELTGDESGDWLEWHPPGSQPASFIGGLRGDYQLQRSTALGDGWYASRYRVAELPIEN